MPNGIRFRPPRVASTPELRWVLLRAFGPPEAPPPEPAGAPPPPRPRRSSAATAPIPTGALPPHGPPMELQADSCLVLARRLDLSSRIGARQSTDLLCRETGPEAAAGFRRDRALTAAWNLRWRALAEELAAVAAELGLSLVFLKCTALDLAGHLAAGARGAADLDVLLAPEEGRHLAGALTARGYLASRLPEMEHQLPPLTAPAGGMVEIHRLLPGVRLSAGGPSATAPELARAGLLAPAPGLPENARLPVREVLIAHAMVHGLAQHGWAPHAYPALRLVADLLDLGLGGQGLEGEGPVGEAPGADGAGSPDGRFRDWVRPALSCDEVTAAEELCRALATGELQALDAGPSAGGAAALLHHLLAGVLVADYRSALRLRLGGAPSDHASPVVLAGAVRRALFPSRAELEALYGPARGRLGRLGLRLRRPFDVGLRALRYTASARRLRRRS